MKIFVRSRFQTTATSRKPQIQPNALAVAMGKRCLGVPSGESCVFGPSGGAAQPKPGNLRCSWCDPALLKEVLAKPNGKARLKQLFAKLPVSIQNKALCKLPGDLQKEFQQKKEAEAETPEKTGEALNAEEAPAASRRNTKAPNDDDPIEEDYGTAKRPRKDERLSL